MPHHRLRLVVAAERSLDRTEDGDELLSTWVERAACARRPALFDDPSRADVALDMCFTCPVLRECRGWALRNAVAGVAGGMTDDARAAWRAVRGLPEPTIGLDDFETGAVVAGLRLVSE